MLTSWMSNRAHGCSVTICRVQYPTLTFCGHHVLFWSFCEYGSSCCCRHSPSMHTCAYCMPHTLTFGVNIWGKHSSGFAGFNTCNPLLQPHCSNFGPFVKKGGKVESWIAAADTALHAGSSDCNAATMSSATSKCSPTSRVSFWKGGRYTDFPAARVSSSASISVHVEAQWTRKRRPIHAAFSLSEGLEGIDADVCLAMQMEVTFGKGDTCSQIPVWEPKICSNS